MHPQETGATEWLANLSIAYVVVVAVLLTILRLLVLRVRHPGGRVIADLSELLTLVDVLVFLVIRPFLVQAFFIPSESMEPTLQGHDRSSPSDDYKDSIHDHIFVNKLVYRTRNPERGEIIVFKAEKKADKERGERVENVLIKRLMGVPGDTIEEKQDTDGKFKVFLNGKALNEGIADKDGKCSGYDYCIKNEMQDPSSTKAGFAVKDRPLKLGEDEYFVMGDNRDISNDSRFWGTVPRNRIIGKAFFICWPLNRIRVLH